jgi:hypothetical protein
VGDIVEVEEEVEVSDGVAVGDAVTNSVMDDIRAKKGGGR